MQFNSTSASLTWHPAPSQSLTGNAASKITPPRPSFRGDAKHRTRNLEIPGLVLRTIPEWRSISWAAFSVRLSGGYLERHLASRPAGSYPVGFLSAARLGAGI